MKGSTDYFIVIDAINQLIVVNCVKAEQVIELKSCRISQFKDIVLLIEKYHCRLIYFIHQEDRITLFNGVTPLSLASFTTYLEQQNSSFLISESKHYLDLFNSMKKCWLVPREPFSSEIYKLVPIVKEYLPQVIGAHKTIRQMSRLTRRIAKVDKTVLIQGPSGSGKELIAQAIHSLSAFNQGEFVDINCSTIPEHLIESILFGHEKGAFTGASENKHGLFHYAANGSLFLDEIAELPLHLQAKILRVLEVKRFRRLGSTKDIVFSGRVIAATHENLMKRVQERKFREDLYYRLTVFTIDVPSLNQRVTDIPHLINAFQANSETFISFDEKAIDLLKQHNWKGNVRELKNLVDRVKVLCDEKVISAEVLAEFINIDLTSSEFTQVNSINTLADSILKVDVTNKFSAIEKALLARALELSAGNKSAAARLLGVHRKVIERKCAANIEHYPPNCANPSIFK